MRFKTLSGRYVSKGCLSYLIKWTGRSRSKPQFLAKQLLFPIWAADVVFEEFPVFGTRLRIDILNATKMIAIEVNGPQHDKFHPFFHNNSRAQFLKGIKRDMIKQEWLELNGIRLVEFVESDLNDTKLFYERLYA